jgi:hypothetical protein
MQFIVLLFGALGFSLVMVAGFTAGRQPDLVLRDAALACLAAAFVGRWFGTVLDHAFTQTLEAARAEQLAAAERKSPPRAAMPAPPAPVRPRAASPVPTTPTVSLTVSPDSRQANQPKPNSS